MLATRLRKVLTAAVVLLLIAFASPVLTPGTAGADSTDSSGYFTYTSDGTSVTVTGCTTLCEGASVSIPSTIEGLPVTSVSPAGFSGKQIAELTIPNSVTTIGGMWYPGFNITRIVFAPNSKITRLNDYQFVDHGSLRSIVLPDHLKEIGQYAFRSSGLESITIPGTVTKIEDHAFQSNVFTSVTIPASVTSLSQSAFPSNVTKTFADPVVSAVTYDLNGGSMPGGASAPTQADTLQNTSFTVGNGTNPVKDGFEFGGWSDGSAAYGDGAPYPMGGSPVTLSAMWVTVTWSYTISNGAVTVNGCTPSCPDAALTIPSTIEDLPVTSVSPAGFSGKPIAQLTVPNSVTSLGGMWYPGFNITRIVFAPNSKITRLENFQFPDHGSLRSIVLPDHLKEIGQYAFRSSGLESITIPGTVTKIEDNAFNNNRFTAVTIPASVTSLSQSAFPSNVTKTFAPPAVSSVTYDINGGTMPGGVSAPTQADTLQNTSFTVGNGTDPVKDGYVFGGWSDGSAAYGDGSPYLMGGSPLTLSALWLTVTWTYEISNGAVNVSGCTPKCPDAALTIPSTIEGLPVTTLTGTNFENVPIAELRIPSSVTSWSGWSPSVKITRMVFAPNSKMTSINGFTNNGNLRSIVLPDHLRIIQGNAFYNAGLDSITIPGTVTTIESGAFTYNRFIAVTIPASVTSLSQYAFPDNVTKTFAPAVTSSVTYDLNGGSMPGGASLPTQADTLQNTSFTVGNGTDPVKDGFEFGGWSDGSAAYGGSAAYVDGSLYPMGGSPVTLSAMWVTVTWTYEISNGAVNVSGCSPKCPDAALKIPSTIEGFPVTTLTRTNFENAPIAQLTIPSSVTSWNGWSPSVKITRMVFAPNSKMTFINGFTNNGNLRSIVMPDHLKEIGQNAFYNAGLDSVTIPGTVTTIADGAFSYNRFTSVTIPASVTSLNQYAFDGNVTKTFAPAVTSSVTYELNGGTLPGGASLPTQADATQNTTFTVGNGFEPVKSGYLFGGWSDGSSAYGDGAPYLMGGSPVTLSALWLTVTWSYTISNGSVTVNGCTPSCPDAALTIPSTIEGLPVTSVTSTNFKTVHIAQLTIPNSVTIFEDIWQGGFNIDRIVFAPGSKITRLRSFLFANNGKLRSIVMPDHLKEIGGYAFYNAGLDSVTIPGTVTTIEGDSFPENRFRSVTIPASVTSLASNAFSGNVTKTFAPPAVSSVTYDINGGTMPGGASLPTQADATQNTTFTVGNGTEPVKSGYLFGGWSDGSSAYADGSSYPMGGSPVTLSAMWVTVTWTYEISNGEVNVSGCTPSCPDAALTIPSTIEGLPVTSVAKNANFSGAEGHVAQLTIPSSVSNFGGVWQANVNVSRIVFAPNSKVTTINGFQFANNGRLRSIVLPDHLRVISGYAFYNAGLDSITIPGTVTTIDGDSFPENRFRSVTIPASVTSLASNAFSGNVTKTFADPVVSSVTYDLNGGSMPGGASAPTQADTLENTSFTVGNGTDPVKTGYGFGGWSDYWGTLYDNGDSFLMSGVPATLTAVWVAPKYSVTYALGGGAGTLPTQSALGSGGSFQVASGAGLSYEGHSFLGWSDGSVTYKAGDLYAVGSSDVTLTALWSANEAPIPDNVLPPGVDDSMIGKPANLTLSGQTDATLTLGSEGTNASVTVPAGALPEGTTLSVYPVLSSAGLADTFPSAHKFVVSMVVTWRAPDGSVPLANVPVTMTINDPAIKKGDKVYQYFDGVLTFMGKAKKAGTITFTFIEDPVFTVSSPPESEGDDGESGGTGGDGSGVSDGSGDASDGVTYVVDGTATSTGVTLPYTGSNVNTPLGIAFVLVTLGGAMVLGTRRKKASFVRNDENEFIS